MTKTEVKKRIEKLRKEVNHHRYLYHVLDKSEISDAALDSLKHELFKLEKEYPEFVTIDSPTQRVSGKALDKFEKVQHAFRQWSFNDAFSDKEMIEWEERLQRILESKEMSTSLDYVCELKIDGLHIVLTYKKGILERAATRGNGIVGENVTQNIRTIEAVPLKLREEVDIVCQGEVWMGKKVLVSLNRKLKKAKKPLLANPRNAAAGAIRQLDSEIAHSRRLDIYNYKIDEASFSLPGTHLEELKKLKELGFKVNRNYVHCKNLKQVFAYYKKWETRREKEDFWFDGIVVKVNDHQKQKSLGYIGKGPRFLIAYKFAAEEAVTQVLEIQVQVGRTGALTPVAVLAPVRLAGSTVSRASLHNQDEIRRLHLKVGDTVIVRKAGDIIPEVVRVLPKLRTGKEKAFKMPSRCPICSTKAVKAKGEVALRCPNKRCWAQEREQLIHFAGRKGLDIEGMGEKIITKLMDEGLMSTHSDIFELKKRSLEPLELFAEKSADNLIVAISHAKQADFHRFLFALGIRYVGEETAGLLAKYLAHKMKKLDIKNFLAVTAKMDREEWQNLEGVGDKVAVSIDQYFHTKSNIKLLQKLHNLGIVIRYEAIKKPQRFAGLNFVLTGSLERFSRGQAKEVIQELGGNVTAQVSKKTDYLVAGQNPGSKHDRAKILGVKIVSEKEFLKLLK